ncbi:MAG: DUF2318 domain-containing protein [Lachnospiraceae bacterium]|nr:DUF2318 domain-containing protein [Lachnospiraceae bacterium]
MKKYLLPAIAGILLVIAIVVVVVIPKKDSDNNDNEVVVSTEKVITTEAEVVTENEVTTEALIITEDKSEAPTEDTVREDYSSDNEIVATTQPDGFAKLNEDGNVVIYADELSEDKVSFIKVSEDSRIELLAKKDTQGNAKVALGTCQSCNGSPGAYYTQVGNELQCNNCGLTFPISVVEEAGGGCHPIMIDEAGIEYTDDGLIIDMSLLAQYEYLFEKVAEH